HLQPVVRVVVVPPLDGRRGPHVLGGPVVDRVRLPQVPGGALVELDEVVVLAAAGPRDRPVAGDGLLRPDAHHHRRVPQPWRKEQPVGGRGGQTRLRRVDREPFQRGDGLGRQRPAPPILCLRCPRPPVRRLPRTRVAVLDRQAVPLQRDVVTLAHPPHVL